MVFDLVGEHAREDPKTIPDCFNLTKRLTGWLSTPAEERPSIEELKNWDPPICPPKVEMNERAENNFHFNVPPLNRGNISTIASPTASILDGLSPAELQRAGLSQNEQFLVIGENDARALVNGEGDFLIVMILYILMFQLEMP